MSVFTGRGVPVRKLLEWASLSAGTHYYKPRCGIRGAKPSTCTINQDGELFDNAMVVQESEVTLAQEFCCYGYRGITGELKEKRWIINREEIVPPVENVQVAFWRQDYSKALSTELHSVQTQSRKGLCKTWRWISSMCTSTALAETLYC